MLAQRESRQPRGTDRQIKAIALLGMLSRNYVEMQAWVWVLSPFCLNDD